MEMPPHSLSEDVEQANRMNLSMDELPSIAGEGLMKWNESNELVSVAVREFPPSRLEREDSDIATATWPVYAVTWLPNPNLFDGFFVRCKCLWLPGRLFSCLK